MKTLEELRRIDEARPFARLAKLVEGCACIAVVGGGALLVLAFATAGWQSWTSALAQVRHLNGNFGDFRGAPRQDRARRGDSQASGSRGPL